MDQARPATLCNSHPTIGFLTDGISNDYANPMWIGIVDAARESGAKLYDLVGAENIDGLVICGGPMTDFVGVQGYRNFCGIFSKSRGDLKS